MVLTLERASQRERAAVAALQSVPRAMRSGLKELGRDELTPMLTREASSRSSGLLARIAASGRPAELKGTPAVRFGGAKAVTSSGVSARVVVRGLEHGSTGRKWSTFQTHSPRGTAYSVTRRSTRQFMPDVGAAGRAIGPAADAVTEPVIAKWLDLVESIVVDAFDAGGR